MEQLVLNICIEKLMEKGFCDTHRIVIREYNVKSDISKILQFYQWWKRSEINVGRK